MDDDLTLKKNEKCRSSISVVVLPRLFICLGDIRMVEELLERQAREMGWERAEGSNTALDAIFMVGDNPRGE